MKISNIYSKYKIPPNLQQHMLRVAAVGNVIASNWKQKGMVSVDRITKTLLLHDMANIIVFDFDKNPGLLGDEEKNVEYWKKVQKGFIEKYGTNEHEATKIIATEIALEEKGLEILKKMPVIETKHPAGKNDWELKVCWYSDFRVAPYGVVNVNERLDDLIERRRVRGATPEKLQHYESLRHYCLSLEKEIQTQTYIGLTSINDKKINSIKEEIFNFSY